MNVWFVCFLLACIDIFGWFLVALSCSGWRTTAVMFTGLVSGLSIAIGVPAYIVVYLGVVDILSAVGG